MLHTVLFVFLALVLHHLAHAEIVLEKVIAVAPLAIHVGCNTSTPYVFPIAAAPTVVFSFVVEDPLAEFISLHLTSLHLPPTDYLQVRPINATAPLYTYRGHYPTGLLTSAIFAQHVVVELVSFGSTNSDCVYGLDVAGYRYSATPPAHESTCDTTNDAASPACDQRPTSPYWRGAKGVVRLLINTADGARWCSGWLLGCENHVLTNYHCISSSAEAVATSFDFRAFGKCNDKCAGAGACSTGNVVVGATLVASSAALDYALVQLISPSVNWSTGNYLKLQTTIVVGDPIYIPQHPFGAGMVVAVKANVGRYGLVETTTYSNADCGLDGMVGYKLNTAAGSSGSPIISSSTNAVVAMHSCGGCAVGSDQSMNGGIPAPWIAQDLARQGALPNCSLAALAPSDGVVEFAVTRGTLFRTARGVSIDVHALNLASDGIVVLDLLSYERRDSDGTFVDVDANCDASYFDSKVYLIAALDGSIVAVNDNSVRTNGAADGSVSSLDAYLNFNVDPGLYYIVVGTTGMTDVDATLAVAAVVAAGTTTGSSSSSSGNGGGGAGGGDLAPPPTSYSAGDLLLCGLPMADHGHYTLTVRTNIDPDSVTSFVAANSYLASTCTATTTTTLGAATSSSRRTAACSYNGRRPPLALQYIVDGTIHQPTSGMVVSIDHISFQVLEPAHVAIEVVSYQLLESGRPMAGGFDDVGFCGRTYIDPVAYVVEDTTNNHLLLLDPTNVVAVADDKMPGTVTPSGINGTTRDPFLDLYLPKGKYVLVVGQYPLRRHEIAWASTATTSPFSPWRDGGVPSDRGNYHVMFSAAKSGVLTPPSAPPNYVDDPCPP
ncbi:Aste57867_21711 [Aphanomyces stellatus]|uniref:Aste57867_21711 protein n=1 Tax=Aphanomyces stellatus TaxID=120398 RepID=A0A485LJG6_9STRA|nr:hypothetical protein As57867_021642 [Aphanomyces stellatus]VFT98380.1 Aste57867_21711 [Aphanomyces stellatus]